MTMKLKVLTVFAVPLLVTALLFSPTIAAQSITIRDNAPATYTVKKDDTLWDIASLFLDQPWLWPELWRTNTQIENPHLIYPGDVLVVKMVNGQPIMQVERDKKRLTLTPNTIKENKPAPIGMLPWDTIASYINQNELLEESEFEDLPYLLGNQAGSMRFVNDDLVLSRRYGRPDDQYRIIRKQDTVTNMAGNVIGIQVHHVADAAMVEDLASSQWLVKLQAANFEAQRGDKLYAGDFRAIPDMKLQAADTQRGHVIGNLHSYTLLGKHDVVIVDLGARRVAPGTVMGIYAQGPDIIDAEAPRYADESNVVKSVFEDGSTVVQPAIKIGELVIFKTFEQASYGIITRAGDLVKRGAIVARP